MPISNKTTLPTLLVCGLLIAVPSFSGRAHASAILRPKGGQTQALSAKSLDVKTRVAGAFARTTVTTIYANPNSSRIEADFEYSAPENAVVTGFAYWFGDEKVPARIVEKSRAARIYQYITTRQRDPALIEMIGKNRFRARIFPVEAGQDLKIEIQMAQKLNATKTGFALEFPLRDETQTPLDFSGSVESDAPFSSNLGEVAGQKLAVSRSNFKAQSDWKIEVPRASAPLRASLLARRDDAKNDGFFALTLVPNTPVAAPRFKISALGGANFRAYDVYVPTTKQLRAGEAFTVFGRFKGAGKAVVAVNNQSVALDFSQQIEANSAAQSLWAQRHIEALSQKEANRFAVVNLSKRFGLVSKWTSWLAIPEEEKARFQREIDEADRANAGRAVAQALARGDRKTANEQKTRFFQLNKKLGDNEPISRVLNRELEIVSSDLKSAQSQKLSRSKIAQLRRLENGLLRVGAVDEKALERRNKAAIEKLAPLYIAEVEAGRAQGKKALALRKQINSRVSRSWEKVQPNGQTNLNEIVYPAFARAREIATEILDQRLKKGLNTSREADLKKRYNHLTKIQFGTDSNYEITPIEKKLSHVQYDWLRENLKHDLRAFRIAAEEGTLRPGQWAQLLKKNADLEKRTGIDAHDLSVFSDLMSKVDRKMAAEVRAKRENKPQNVVLAQELAAASQSLGLKTPFWDVRDAYVERAREVGKEILFLKLKEGENSPKIAPLQQKLEAFAKNTDRKLSDLHWSGAWDAYSQRATDLAKIITENKEETPQAEKVRSELQIIGKTIDPKSWGDYDAFDYRDYPIERAWRGRAHEAAYRLLETLEKSPSKAAPLRAELEKVAAKTRTGDAQKFLDWEARRRKNGEPLLSAEEFRVRPGDPLISVIAPRDTQKIVAILPTGEVKTLLWNEATKAFEARFDVPTYALDGDYTVQIVILDALGNRRRLAMNFAVDTSAPSGNAGLFWKDGTPKLRLESDAQTDRVSAFTPWNARVELRRDESGAFTAPLEIPLEWREKAAQIRFVLTDKAHNRTEILVDLAP